MDHLEARQRQVAISSFVSRELPDLNISCRGRSAALSTWIRAVGDVLADVDQIAAHLDRARRLDLLQKLGFITESGERHAQFAGYGAGFIVRRFPGLEQALVIAAGSERVPTLTAELYWERNRGPAPLTFTGEPHELFFISAVHAQTEIRTTVNNRIRGLLVGQWRPDTAEGARLLRTAATEMSEAHCQYQDFRHGPEGRPLMTPAEFNEMRVWLGSTVVLGEHLAGPNAAYIAEMVATDYLLGTADEAYDAYVGSFARYVSPEGRRLLTYDCARPPLTVVLAEALGLDEAAFDRADSSDIAARVSRAPRALMWTLLAFKDLVGQLVGASGAHVGLINVFLTQYGETLPAQDRERLPVDPSSGTGGHSHEHTLHLHHMRRDAPRVRKLLGALKESGISEHELARVSRRRSI